VAKTYLALALHIELTKCLCMPSVVLIPIDGQSDLRYSPNSTLSALLPYYLIQEGSKVK